ncbi:MAG: hypothetical protein H7233_16480 [Pseudorhodobacter sp.]|nr:hypothetical protein [Frankiaceae bacterium]
MSTTIQRPTSRRSHRRLAVALCLPVGALVALLSPLGGSATAGGPSARNTDLAAARQATASFHDVQAARDAGYGADVECVESPAGVMGFHHVNPARFGTDPRRPAGLLYVPSSNGGVRLAGVEYIVVDADGLVSTDSDRPTMFGRPFDGPMRGHFEGMPVHYDLHVWTWAHNPDGIFAQWNPALSCT